MENKLVVARVSGGSGACRMKMGSWKRNRREPCGDESFQGRDHMAVQVLVRILSYSSARCC